MNDALRYHQVGCSCERSRDTHHLIIDHQDIGDLWCCFGHRIGTRTYPNAMQSS